MAKIHNNSDQSGNEKKYIQFVGLNQTCEKIQNDCFSTHKLLYLSNFSTLFNKLSEISTPMTHISKPVYRFAPSPTGFLHVGSARTAIFNWLLARQNGGKFFVRIEDTDRIRSTEESVQQIINSLSWLGINWDGDMIFQSQRVTRHRQVANLLLEKNKAYRCFCTKEELQAKRKKAEVEKGCYLYDGTCRNLSPEEIDTFIQKRKPFTIRLRIPQGVTAFTDGVHGNMHSQNSEIDDFVILRADQTPVYQLAVAVDDYDLGVTDIVRGDDHLSNTPKQILIYRALDWSVPRYAHLPLILGPDRNRLSKRHGAASIEEFRDQGILADALFNYLCLLGWSPGDDKEIMSREELLKIFSLKRANKANAVFDYQKLLWINGQYLTRSDARSLVKNLSKKTLMIVDRYDKEHVKALIGLIDLVKERARTFSDLEDGINFFINPPKDYDISGVNKLFTPEALNHLETVLDLFSKEHDFSVENLEKIIRDLAEQLGIKAGVIIHPLRLALTGKTSSPGIFEVMSLLGKEEVLKRLDMATNYIRDKVAV
jgi:glutamyl-tRNA synthetase